MRMHPIPVIKSALRCYALMVLSAFGVVELGVNSLHRVSIGELKIPEGLKLGECVEIGQNELNLIKC